MWITNEEFNIFQAGYAASTATNTTHETCAHVNMGLYESVAFVFAFGNNTTAGANNIFILEASSPAYLGMPTGKYNYRYCTTGGISTGSYDTFTASATGASTALATTTGAGACYILTVKADDLSATTGWLAPSMSTNAGARNISIIAICKPRYLQNTMVPASTGTSS